MNDTIGPECPVPSLLLFGVVPSLPVINKPLPSQKERMEAMALTRAEISTITAELRTSQAIRSKLPPSTQFHFETGD